MGSNPTPSAGSKDLPSRGESVFTKDLKQYKINMRASGDSYVCELGEYHGQQFYLFTKTEE